MFFQSDKNIYKVSTDKGGFYQIFDSKLGRYLTFNKKFIGIHRNYKGLKNTYFYDLLEEVLEKRNHIHNVLIFGLGSGIMQKLLFEKFSNLQIVTIESDPTLVDINNYFFHFENSKNNQIIISDAFQFVKNSENIYDFHNKFDLIIIDFNLLGSHFYSDIFLKEIKNFLNNKGLFISIFQRNGFLENNEVQKFVQRLSMYYNNLTLLYSKKSILEVFCSDI